MKCLGFTEDIEGEFVGIGVYITKDTENNTILVYGTIPDSPAQASGLKTGDIITSVDGVECNGDDYDTITNNIKGVEGTKVTIGILRDGEELSFQIERKNSRSKTRYITEVRKQYRIYFTFQVLKVMYHLNLKKHTMI